MLGELIMGGGMVADLIGGSRAKRKQERLWQQFQADLRKREAEQVHLERVARGEIQTSLAESKHLFGQTMAAISASSSVASRRLMEDLNRREAAAGVRGRQRGMMGSSATATMALAQERDVFRAALDAEINRSAKMGQVMQAQAGHEAQIRGDIANSYRREGNIGAQAGQEYRSALENSQVGYTPISGGLGQLLGQLGMLGGGGATEQKYTVAEMKGVEGALRANPWTGGMF